MVDLVLHPRKVGEPTEIHHLSEICIIYTIPTVRDTMLLVGHSGWISLGPVGIMYSSLTVIGSYNLMYDCATTLGLCCALVV